MIAFSMKLYCITCNKDLFYLIIYLTLLENVDIKDLLNIQFVGFDTNVEFILSKRL